MNHKRIIVVCMLFLAVFCSTGMAEDTLDIHIIASEPLGYVDSNGYNTGYHWDYAKALETISGLNFRQTLMPYSRIWHSLENGAHDGGIVFRSANRDAYVEYVAPLITIKNVVIARKGIELNTYEDLYRLKTIGTMPNRLDPRFDSDEKLKDIKTILHDYTTMVKMIREKRLDAIAGNGLALNYLLKKYEGLEDVQIPGIVLGERESWFQLSKKSQHLDKMPVLSQAIRTFMESGEYDRIMEKYFGTSWKHFAYKP